MQTSRRTFLQGSGIGLLSVSVAGGEMLLTPRAARAAGADLRVLTDSEAATLEAIGEILVPGAAAAGIVPFVDAQLAAPPDDCLLMASYLNVPPPYVDFYRPSLAAIEGLCAAQHEKSFAELDETEAVALIASFSGQQPEAWTGPPAQLVYLLLRSDAVDVVYGTRDGFARMNIPYMAHIVPPTEW